MVSSLILLQAWALHVLADPYRGADGLHVYDADQDGVPDAAVAFEADAAIAVARGGQWPAPTWSAPLRHIVWTSGERYEDVGRAPGVGILAAAEGGSYPGVYLYPDDGSNRQRARFSEAHSWASVTTGDVDSDGHIDIIAGGHAGVWWWQGRPSGGSIGAWTRHVLWSPSGAARPLWVHVEDDGVVMWTDRQIGGLWRGGQQIVSGEGTLIACLADMDADGDEDVVMPLESGRLRWAERPSWQTHELHTPWAVDDGTVAKGCAYDAALGLVVTTWRPGPHDPQYPHRVWLLRGAWSGIDPPGRVLKTDEPALVDWDLDGDLDVLITDEGAGNSGRDGLGLVGLENPGCD